MDARVTFAAMLLVTLAVDLILALVYWTRRAYPWFGYWLAGALCRTGSAVLFLLPRDRFPPWLTILAANLLFQIEPLLVIRGTLLYQGRAPPRPAGDVAIAASFLALFAGFTYLAPDANVRIAIFSLYGAALSLRLLLVLRTRPPPWSGAAEVLQAWVLGTAIVVHVARVAYTWAAERGQVDILAPSLVQGVTILALAGASLLVSLTQLIMYGQRVEHDLMLTRERLEQDLAARAQEAGVLRTSEARYRRLFENQLSANSIFDTGQRLVAQNALSERLLGRRDGEALGKHVAELFGPASGAEIVARMQRVLASGQGELFETCFDLPSGRKYFQSAYAPIHDEAGAVQGVQVISQEITKRKLAEAALRESEQKLRTILDSTPFPVALVDTNGDKILFRSKGALTLFGHSPETVAQWREAAYPDPDYRREVEERWRAGLAAARASGQTVELGEHRITCGDGSVKICEQHLTVLPDGLVATFHDVSEKRRLEREREQLQAHLHQAQKMESIGRLAGGVAHDFNNMLGTIIGHVDVLAREAVPGTRLREDLDEIRRAAARSSALTRQLLAFASKQATAPAVLDLDETVEGMLKMLRRLIGEDITLVWQPGRSRATVKMDPSHVDQLLANLAVNARDAIAGVGRVTIQTRPVTVDAAEAARRPGLAPGDYVELAVGDDGCGMDAATSARIFEPFFTTKGPGKGTGLGLATVYGIVQQNRGVISVASALGKGTTFRILLPRYAGDEAPARKGAPDEAQVGGSETVLLVEDEAALLRIGRRMLEGLGYVVLPANTPAEALRLAREHPGEIALLVTDVVMPELNGRDLAKQVIALRPRIRHLFASGYSTDIIAKQGMLEEGVHFVQKPFTQAELAQKVREALA